MGTVNFIMLVAFGFLWLRLNGNPLLGIVK